MLVLSRVFGSLVELVGVRLIGSGHLIFSLYLHRSLSIISCVSILCGLVGSVNLSCLYNLIVVVYFLLDFNRCYFRCNSVSGRLTELRLFSECRSGV